MNGLGFILPFGLLVGLIALIALGLLSRMRFEISGMFTFERLALYLTRFVKSFLIYVTPLMYIRPGSYGVVKLRRALLVLIFLRVALPSRIPVVM